MIAILLVLLLAAHLICMNVASAGPLVCIAFDYRAARREPESLQPAAWLAWKSFWLGIIGAVLGFLIAAVKWNSEYADVLQRFELRLGWGAAEFVVSLALTAGYAWWLSIRPHVSGTMRLIRSAVAVLTATNLLYHFPTLFTLIAAAAGGRIEVDRVTSPVFRQLVGQAEVPAMTTHFILASVAVSGAALMYRAWRDSSSDPSIQAAVWGARIALGATVLQIPVGLWLAISIPAASQRRIMGGDLVGSGLFMLSILGSLMLLHQLAAVALGDTSRRSLARAIGTLLAVVLMMAGVLQRVNG